MPSPVVTRRLVFHIGGYDPITPPATVQRRFARELARFQITWSVKASIDALDENGDEAKWHILTKGPNWNVETDYRLVLWDDVIENYSRLAFWHRIPLGLISFMDFVWAGALWGYLRTNWHYAVFFLYPFGMFGASIAVLYHVGLFAFHRSGSVPVAIASCVFVFSLLLLGPARWLHVNALFDDWNFSREYIRNGNFTIEKRLDRLAGEIIRAARSFEADELLIFGHSLGAVLAIDLLDRALKLDPTLGKKGTPVTFLSIGSSILKIGLHCGATSFRAAVERVARTPGIFWGDYQARVDLMNFYNRNPMAEMSLPTRYGPAVKLVEFSQMLEPAIYRRIRLRFYRVHCQFISGNDRRALYDYFMLCCGPISAKFQTLAPDGALSMVQKDGTLIDIVAATKCETTYAL